MAKNTVSQCKIFEARVKLWEGAFQKIHGSPLLIASIPDVTGGAFRQDCRYHN